jgi:hypothetical protein
MNGQEGQATTHCPSCGNEVPLANLPLHELHCRGKKNGNGAPQHCVQLLVIVIVPLLLSLLGYQGYEFLQWKRRNLQYRYDNKHEPGFATYMLNQFLGVQLRNQLLNRMPPSFLPDVWPESSFAWTHVIDNFWVPRMLPPLKDRSHLVLAECLMSEAESRALKDDFLGMTDRLGKLHWNTLPWSKGICGNGNGTSICAVHRWNAEIENKGIGRVQCWTDPSLLHWEPSFVNKNYNALFHPVFVNVTVFVCLVDIPGYAATLASPAPFLQINKLAFYCPSNFEHTEQIQPGDLPADVIQSGFQLFFFQFLDEFLVHLNDADREDDEVIDLDLLEDRL